MGLIQYLTRDWWRRPSRSARLLVSIPFPYGGRYGIVFYFMNTMCIVFKSRTWTLFSLIVVLFATFFYGIIGIIVWYTSLKLLLGASGLVSGGITGVLRSPNPMIHSVSTGIHWFAFGTSFWCQYTPSSQAGWLSF